MSDPAKEWDWSWDGKWRPIPNDDAVYADEDALREVAPLSPKDADLDGA